MQVMVDFGSHTPPLSLERLLLDEFRPGDIFTHCFANVGGRTAIVDENGKVRPYVWEAQKKGIVFDIKCHHTPCTNGAKITPPKPVTDLGPTPCWLSDP